MVNDFKEYLEFLKRLGVLNILGGSVSGLVGMIIVDIIQTIGFAVLMHYIRKEEREEFERTGIRKKFNWKIVLCIVLFILSMVLQF